MTTSSSSASTPGHAAFAAALLNPDLPPPPGLRTWNGSDPARRLAVYRNNVISSLIDALADTFPVTQQLVGEEFFRAMASVYVRRHPPRTRVLAHYGADFADFIAAFEPAAVLPYLADVARLEFARLQSMHAADDEAIDADTLAQALADPQALAGMHFVWRAALHVLASPHAVVSLWAAHQVDDPADAQLHAMDLAQPEQALVLRAGADVLVLPVDAATAHFVQQTQAGAPFAEAAAATTQAHPEFDLSATLSLLLNHAALSTLSG